MVNTQDPGPLRKDYPPAVVGMATHSFSWPGRAEADFITVDSKGKAKILFMSTTDLPAHHRPGEAGLPERDRSASARAARSRS